MNEVENGYEIVNNMTTAKEGFDATDGQGDEQREEDNGTKPVIEASLFGDTENLLKIDPSRRGPRDWFNGCNPEFVQLVFWESGKRSSVVFGAVLVLLLAFASCSAVSLVAYCNLLLLALSAGFTVYKRIHSSISKAHPDTHPLKALLELDLTVKPARLAGVLEPLCEPFNRFVIRARAVLLIENVLDSAKFAGLMWLLTYIGAVFNALTLLMLAWVGCFTVPIIYERNQHFVDALVNDVAKKFRAAGADLYAGVEPKLQAALDRMPPAVKNAFNQIQGKTQDKLE